MIRINKPATGPTVPYNTGKLKGQCKLANATATLKGKFDVHIQSGKHASTFVFSPSTDLYGHDIIKEALKVKVQKNKCCYCEKRIHDGYEVEHYRPKDGYKQTKNEGEAVNKPGYYWLTYSWSNLFYSCGSCNNSKSTYFPLNVLGNRAGDHNTDESCTGEEPLLIDLVNEDPKDFITFRWVEAFPTEKQYERGKIMIDAVNLNRQGLFEERKEHWDRVESQKLAIERRIRRNGLPKCIDEVEEHEEYLRESISDKSPFSSMISHNLEFLQLRY